MNYSLADLAYVHVIRFQSMMATGIIYAADIGSTRLKKGGTPNFGWARIDPDAGGEVRVSTDIEHLAIALTADLAGGRSVALGLECPLFMPVPVSADSLCHRREGEGNRSFAAPPGLAVAALGLHQAAWLLRYTRTECNRSVPFALDLLSWMMANERQVFFCWEAFISGSGHSDEHVRDAATAADAFREAVSDENAPSAIHAESPLSLIGAAALWSGWRTDVGVLHEPCVVVKPLRPYDGALRAYDVPGRPN